MKIGSISVTISDILFIIVCTLLLSLPASYEPHHFAKTLFIGAFIQSLAYSLLIWLLINKSVGLKKVVFTILFVLFFIETFTYFRFDSRFNPSILTIILQTSIQEISEFFKTFVFSYSILGFVFLTVVVYFILYKLLFKCTKLVGYIDKLQLLILSIFILFGFSLFVLPLPVPLGHNTVNELFISADFVRNKHEEIEVMKQMLDKIEIYDTPKSDDAPVIVLVLGESFNKYHSSLYGYNLATSPFLVKERDKGQLIVYSDAKSPTNGTSFAMRYVFTLKSCDNDSNLERQCILMPGVFRKSGYRVHYFDNQYTRSSGGALDYSCGYFLNPQYINDYCFDYRNTETSPYDGEFIEKYKDRFAKQNKSLNIIHLMGQHFDAECRYPDQFRIFSSKDIQRPDLDESERQQVAVYDNATRYNDYVLSRIIHYFSDTDAVIIYFSDHGEQVYDGKQHYFGRTFGSIRDEETLKNVYQIPFMVWCSESFKAKHSDKYQALVDSKDDTICCDDVPYLLFDLAGIDFNYSCRQRSFIDHSYQPHQTVYE